MRAFSQRWRIAIHSGLLATAALLYPQVLPAQCAMCWSSLANSSEGATLVRGFNAGILFLLVVPFLLVGALAWLIYQANHRNARLMAVSPKTELPPYPAARRLAKEL